MWACERCVLKWCQKPSYPSENIVFPPKHNYMWCNLDFYCDPERVHNSLWGRKPTWASPNSKQWWLFFFFFFNIWWVIYIDWSLSIWLKQVYYKNVLKTLCESVLHRRHNKWKNASRTHHQYNATAHNMLFTKRLLAKITIQQ